MIMKFLIFLNILEANAGIARISKQDQSYWEEWMKMWNKVLIKIQNLL